MNYRAKGCLTSTGLLALGFAMAPLFAFAAGQLIVPEPAPVNSQPTSQAATNNAAAINALLSRVVNAEDFGDYLNPKTSAPRPSDVSGAAVTAPVAMLTIIADPTFTAGSFGISSGNFSVLTGTHAFITIRNVSSSNINVGKFSGIAPNTTMSVGTWGNRTEHIGLWYDLEEYAVYWQRAYAGRVSVSYLMTATQLNSLNTFIINNDYWSKLNNCSSFASAAWNTIVGSAYWLNAGSPSTPKFLAGSIKVKFPANYLVGAAVPYNYVVYYAKGTGSPVRSTIYK